MADQPDEVLWKIAAKYPAVKSDSRAWDKVSKLARTGKAADAEAALELARETTMGDPRLRVRHWGAIKARARRMEFLKAQKRHDAEVADLLRTAAERMAGAVASAAGDDGTVSPGRLGSLLKRLEDINRETYKIISSGFIALLRAAVKSGLRSGMDQAEAVVDRLRADKAESAEGTTGPALAGQPIEEADPLKAKVRYSMSSAVFKRLFKGTLRKTMTAGLFGKTGVSNRVWDLRDENFLQLKRTVAGGIARGESAAKISRAIRGLLTQPATLRGEARDDARPGRGVYRSAYKNAMRLTRTETNRAFVNADTAFASKKGWQVMWHTVAPNPCPICAGLSGKKMTPEEFDDKYPIHPHCLLPGTLVSCPDAVAGSHAFYNGWSIDITLSNGSVLSVTENHPIFTPGGFMLAKSLHKGHDVIVASNPERIVLGIDPDYQYGPSRVENVFHSLLMSRPMLSRRVETSTEDFHGDARFFDGEVHIVGSDRLLRIYHQAIPLKPGKQEPFNGGDVLRTRFASPCGIAESFKRPMTPANCAMSGIGHPQEVCSRESCEVESLSGFVTTNGNTHRGKPLEEIPPTDLERASAFQQRFSAFIGMANVVHIRRRLYSGHVFDLQAGRYGVYIASGVIVKNCLCYPSAVVPEVG